MIDKVSHIVLRKGDKFTVGGYNSYGWLSKWHVFKTYPEALRYSRVLSDFYKVQVIES